MTDPCSKKGMFICHHPSQLKLYLTPPPTKWKYEPVDPPHLQIEISLKASPPQMEIHRNCSPKF